MSSRQTIRYQTDKVFRRHLLGSQENVSTPEAGEAGRPRTFPSRLTEVIEAHYGKWMPSDGDAQRLEAALGAIPGLGTYPEKRAESGAKRALSGKGRSGTVSQKRRILQGNRRVRAS
jgi:hypothetical protein